MLIPVCLSPVQENNTSFDVFKLKGKNAISSYISVLFELLVFLAV